MDPALEGRAATDKAASKDALLKRLRWLKDNANEDCMVVVTLSGHGLKVDNNRFFFLCHRYDSDKEPAATALAWEDFQQYFADLPCPVVVVMDTCHSGAITLQGRSGNPQDELEAAVDDALRKLGKSKNGIAVVAACRATEMAQEHPAWGHGALTLAVLELIQGKKLYEGETRTSRAELPQGKSVLTLEDLQRYAADRVEDLVGSGQAVVVKASDGLYLRDIPIAAIKPQ